MDKRTTIIDVTCLREYLWYGHEPYGMLVHLMRLMCDNGIIVTRTYNSSAGNELMTYNGDIWTLKDE